MKNLQSESSSPLYHQLMQRLAEDIERGKYPVGSRIPPEHELEALYKVSRVTVRRALSELTAEGLLEKKQGKGTFVSTPRISQDLKSIHSFHDACKLNGFRGGTILVHVKEVNADDSDICELELREGSKVVETLRVFPWPIPILRTKTLPEVFTASFGTTALSRNRRPTIFQWLLQPMIRQNS